MIFQQRKLWLWMGIVLAAIAILTIFTAPNSNKLMAGSTYSKEPDGYGAWYEYMSNKGVTLKRWQKPFNEIIHDSTDNSKNKTITYVQIFPDKIPVIYSNSEYYKWVGKGNKLIILGVEATATKAPFTSQHSYKNLQFQLKTTRRKQKVVDSIIQDEYGAVVWRTKVKQGEIIYAVSPYIAANAYQGVSDNFEFMAQLADSNNEIIIDEYIHGYKDIETKQAERQETLSQYLSQTLWLPLTIQGLLITIISLIFSWQRFGQAKKIKVTNIDNSQAYIEALAGVLEKAESTDFVIKVINKDEQLKLQQKLGLGRKMLPTNILIAEWVKQTQKSRNQLQQLLQISPQKKRISEVDLLKWIQKWQLINKEEERNNKAR
ncbi:conserved hypothetical protein [Hyella patelloides LEGE 07179]|uniref:DUF4350 domain-containing protein n=1 Tax=Hyella patelloides LEGE 07179 TaxID=945734 RepID=A0A563VJ83_9CYAN|nr:DUF4350 domain-containing protein [Hyella patelloides]VEP11504.1 conserved hypothetical protein [Hyella patelloides LEGE 07179]